MFPILWSCLLVAQLATDNPPAAKPSEKKPASLEMLKLPSGAIVVVCEDIKEALRLYPKAVVLSPDKYQELLEQIEQLKRQLKTERPDPPSECRLSGHVDGDQVHMRVVYRFRTERPSALVSLGAARTWPTGAALDDNELPLLQQGEDGLVVQVEAPGSHQFTLDLLLPLTARGSKGNDLGFDLGLPRAAITVLDDFELAGDVLEARCGSRVLRTKRDAGGRRRLEGVSLGPLERLELSWKGPAAVPHAGAALLASRSRAVVRVSDTFVTTDVEMTLEVVRGETVQWRVLVPLPPQATFDLTRPQVPDERVQRIVLPDANDPVLTVRLRQTSAESLVVAFRIRQPRTGAAMPIGPFVVLDAFRQRGTIEIRAPADLRLRFQEQGEVSRREVAEDQRREGTVAVFQYWGGQPVQDPKQPVQAPLSMEVETVRGVAEARAGQTLRLVPNKGWQVTTKLDITPVRTSIDRLEIKLPGGYEYDRELGAAPTELVEEVTIDAPAGMAQVRLAQRQTRPFSLVLTGLVVRPPPTNREVDVVHLDLPRPATWSTEGGGRTVAPLLDRGGSVTVLLPETAELVGHLPATASPVAGTREYSWPTARLPARAEFSYRTPSRQSVVTALVDLRLSRQAARVRHRITSRSGTLPAALTLQVPESVSRTVRVVEGGRMQGTDDQGRGLDGLDPNDWTLWFDSPAAGKPASATLEYSFPLPATKQSGFAVPLIQPAGTVRGESRVRVWSEVDLAAAVSSESWEELPTELDSQYDALPDVVVRGATGAPLVLRVQPVARPLATALVERALVGVTVAPGLPPSYRAQFRLRKLHVSRLELELPGTLRPGSLDVLLDGRRVPTLPLDDSGRQGRAEQIVWLRVEPELYTKPVVLDVRYQLEECARGKVVYSMLAAPPQIIGAVALGRTRWQFDAPPGWLVISPAWQVTPDYRWGRRGWLAGPVPEIGRAGLERWVGDATGSIEEGNEPDLVCWSTASEAIDLWLAPQETWLFFCSLPLLVLGLAGLFAWSVRPVFRLTVFTLGLGVGAVCLISPQLIPVIAYGCEPGFLIVLLVLGIHWIMHHRYRRQLTSLPTFTRLKQGSSLVRAGSSRGREQPATDEPARRGSSAPGTG